MKPILTSAQVQNAGIRPKTGYIQARFHPTVFPTGSKAAICTSISHLGSDQSYREYPFLVDVSVREGPVPYPFAIMTPLLSADSEPQHGFPLLQQHARFGRMVLCVGHGK